MKCLGDEVATRWLLFAWSRRRVPRSRARIRARSESFFGSLQLHSNDSTGPSRIPRACSRPRIRFDGAASARSPHVTVKWAQRHGTDVPFRVLDDAVRGELVRTVRWGCVAIVVAACGADSGLDVSPVGLDERSAQTNRAFCQHAVACGAADDVDACVAAQVYTVLLTATERAMIMSGKVIYDPVQEGRCLAAMAAESCDTTHSHYPTRICADAEHGTLGAGASCASSQECRSRSCQVGTCDAACCLGVCVGDAPQPPGQTAGAACSVTDIYSGCAAPLYCDLDSGRCALPKPVGAACATDSECAPDLGCMGGPRNGTCARVPTLGERCTGRCGDFGSYCDSGTQLCTKRIPLGGACSDIGTCQVGLRCDASGRCAPGIPLGESCTVGDLCAGGLFCDPESGKCASPKPNGERCLGGFECASVTCDSTTSMCVPEQVCI